MKDIFEEFRSLLGKRILYPSLNNYSPFIQGSEYNTNKYFYKWYDGEVKCDFFLHFKEGSSQVWLIDDELRKASLFGFKESILAPEKFNQRITFFYNQIKEMDKIYPKYTYEHIASLDEKSLLALVVQLRDMMWHANGSVIFSVVFDKELCRSLLQSIKYPLTQKQLDSIWEKATIPAFESFDKAQEREFVNVIKKDWNTIIEHCQYFLTDYYSMRELSAVDSALKQRYGNTLDALTKVKQAHDTHTVELLQRRKAFESWLKTLSPAERTVAQYIQNVMEIRDHRKNFFAKGWTIISRIAEKMFAQENIARDLIVVYTVRELLLGSEHLRSIKSTLAKRKQGFVQLIPDIGEPRFEQREVDSISKKVNDLFISQHTNHSTIKGQCAYPGIIRGRVSIVLNALSPGNFSQGDILVTGMTRPEYVPLMKKAVAIITDEGGITCHAAIVSRELRKPCVTGTRIATKSLKDGDLVEVDATNGVVKKI